MYVKVLVFFQLLLLFSAFQNQPEVKLGWTIHWHMFELGYCYLLIFLQSTKMFSVFLYITVADYDIDEVKC